MKKKKPSFVKINKNDPNPHEVQAGNNPVLENKPLPGYATLSSPSYKQADFTQNFEDTSSRKIETQIILLEKFIPRKYHEEMNLANHPHYINLYSMNRRFLTISCTNCILQPNNMTMPYSEGFPILTGLVFIKILQSDPNQLQVILYKGSNDKEYVLKRFLNPFNFSNITESDYKVLDNFLQKRYLEFSLMQQFSACPHSATPIFFNIVLLKEILLVATELMMDYAGEPIENSFPFKSSEQIFDFIWQLTETLRFLEDNKIEHNDIKRQNVLLDKALKMNLIKIIDFDIGSNQSVTCKPNKGMGLRGHTAFYCSPEIINLNDDNYTGSEEINPFKAQMYSTGVLVLESTGFFITKINEKLFDSYKINTKKYNEVEKKIKEFALTHTNDILMQNLIEICNICISFDPFKRPTAFELQSLLKGLKSSSPQKVIEDFLNMQENRLKTCLNSKEKKFLLEFKIEEYKKLLMQKNKELEEINEINKNNKLISGKENEEKMSEEALKLKEKLDIFTSTQKNLESEIINLKDNLKILSSEKDSLNDEKSKLKENNISCITKISELNNQLKESSENCEQLSTYSKNDFDLKADQITQFRNLNANLTQQNIQNETKINQLKVMFIDNSEKLSGLEKGKNVIQSKFQSLNEELKNKDGLLVQNQKIYGNLNNKINILLKENKEMEEKSNELNYLIENNDGDEINNTNPRKSNASGINQRLSLDKLMEIYLKNIVQKEEEEEEEDDFKKLDEIQNNLNHNFRKTVPPQSNNTLDDDEDKTLNELQRLTVRLAPHSPELEKLKNLNLSNALKTDIICPFSNFKKMYQRFKDKFNEMGIIINPSENFEQLVDKMKINFYLDKIHYLYNTCNPLFIEKELLEQNVKVFSNLYINENCQYSGQMANKVPDGKGVVSYKDQTTYSAIFTKGKILDFAIIEKENDIYVGIFNIEFLDGIGFKCIDYKSNKSQNKFEIYFGYFRTLEIEGFGKMFNSDGETFTGDWYRNSREGAGKLCSKTGEIYVGGWSKNMKNGYGTSKYLNGDTFNGEWKDDKKEGKGKFTLKNGSYYDGSYKNDEKHGIGILHNHSGASYQGKFENGKYHGVGKFSWPDGHYFEGLFKNGKRNGKGKLSEKNGEIVEGTWEDGKRVGKFSINFKKKVSYNNFTGETIDVDVEDDIKN